MSEKEIPKANLNTYPTADDPFDTVPEGECATQAEKDVKRLQAADPNGDRYPSYEVNQDPQDHVTGGSTDTHDFMTSANSGDDTPQLQEEDDERSS